jgi:ketosteroid isomerase-like protein
VTPTDVAAVEAANEEFYLAFEHVDLDRMHAVWDDDEDVTCVHPGWPLLRGRGRVMRSWALIFANTPYIQFFLTDVHVQVTGEIAVVTCAENILTSVGDTEGDATVVATNVFRRRDDGWRLVVHHGSPVAQRGEPGDRQEEE